MPKKIGVKRILELKENGLSGKEIAIALSTSRNSVPEVVKRFDDLKLN